MHKSPKDQAREMFNKIRFMQGEDNNSCTTCDYVIKPILYYMINELIKPIPIVIDVCPDEIEYPYDEYYHVKLMYWSAVREEIRKL